MNLLRLLVFLLLLSATLSAQVSHKAELVRWQKAIATVESAASFFEICDLVVVAHPTRLGKAPKFWCGGVVPRYQTIVFELEEVLRGGTSLQRVPVRFPVLQGSSAARTDGVVGLSKTWFGADRRFLLGLKLVPQGEGESLVYSSWLSDFGMPLTSIDLVQARRMLAGDPWDSGFPESWAGSWSGELQYAKPGGGATGVPGGPKRHIQMGLLLGKEKKDGPYRWSIRYGAGEDAQIRPYELIEVDPAKGHFKIDEHNGILIDSYLAGSTLYARFDVKTVSVEAIYRRRGDTMIVTMISTELKPTVPEDALPEGGVPEDAAPEDSVRSHRVISVTRAVLTRTQ